MKNRKILVVLLVITALFTSIGSAGAYMRKQTEVVSSVYVPGTVACKVHETLNDEETQKNSIQVENTGNITAYLRVRLVTYWVDNHGDIVFKESKTLKDDVKYDNENWIRATTEDVFYYKYPVMAEDDNSTSDKKENMTLELLKEPIVLEHSSQDNTRQVVEVFAEAIQSLPIDAVTSAWPVTVASDGMIAPIN